MPDAVTAFFAPELSSPLASISPFPSFRVKPWQLNRARYDSTIGMLWLAGGALTGVLEVTPPLWLHFLLPNAPLLPRIAARCIRKALLSHG